MKKLILLIVIIGVIFVNKAFAYNYHYILPAYSGESWVQDYPNLTTGYTTTYSVAADCFIDSNRLGSATALSEVFKQQDGSVAVSAYAQRNFQGGNDIPSDFHTALVYSWKGHIHLYAQATLTGAYAMAEAYLWW